MLHFSVFRLNEVWAGRRQSRKRRKVLRMKMRATGSACRCCRIVAVFFIVKMCNAWQSRWEMARRRPSLPWWTRRARRGRIRSRTASSSTFIGRPFWKILVFWWIYPWSNHFDKSLCFVELTLDIYISRPNTGQQVKQETLGELKKKYKKVIWNLLTCVQWCKLSPSSLERWMEMSARNIGTCSLRAVPRLVATPSGRWNYDKIEDPILSQAANSRYVCSLLLLLSGQLQEQNGGDGVRDRPPTENL